MTLKYCFLVASLSISWLAGQTPSQNLITTMQQTHQTVQEQSAALKDIAQRYIFAAWPEYPSNSPITNPPLYPTTSINEAAVTALWGPGGLNVDVTILNYIKAFYFYFEYCVRRERAAQVLTLAKQYGIAYEEILQTASWDSLIAVVNQKNKGPINYATVTPSQEAWESLVDALSLTFESEKKDLGNFWQLITSTSFWTAFPLTNQDLQNSLFWQMYLKTMITKGFMLDKQLLDLRHQNEQLLFRYIPYLETAYYLPDYTQQRSTAELTQLALLLNEQIRTRLLDQCIEWNTLKIPKTTSYDYTKLIQAATCFEQSHFYQLVQIISQASCNPQLLAQCDPACDPLCAKETSATQDKRVSSLCQQSPFVLQKDGTYTFKHVALPAPYKHELLFLSMAITIQTLTYDLFSAQNLTKTLTIVGRVTTQPQPSVLLYTVQDGLYLQDWTALTQEIPQAVEQNIAAQQSQQLTSPRGSTIRLPSLPAAQPSIKTRPRADNEPVKPQGLFSDWIKHFGGNIIHEFEASGQAIYASANDMYRITRDEGAVFYYQSGLATLIQGMPPSQAAQMAQTYKDAVNSDFKSFSGDVQKLVTNAVMLSQAVGGGPIEAALAGIGEVLNDPNLSADYENMLDSVANALGTFVSAAVGLDGQVAVRLDTDAIATIADVVVIVATGGTQGTGAFVNDWKIIGRDIVTSLLETMVIGLATIKAVLKDLIQAVGYLIKLITDSIITFGAGVATVLNPIGWIEAGGIANYYAQVHATLETHQFLISQIVTVGLLLGVTVATGGSTVWLAVGIGATLAFGSFMIISGAQEDKQIADITDEIKDYFARFAQWTNNQTVIVQGMQDALITEIQKGLTAEIVNRQLGLGFYQNYFNQTLQQFEQQERSALGAYQAQLLQQDSNKLVIGDVGTLYGHTTGWLDLNPSQGLALYEPSRKQFAQEVAQMPATFSVGTDPTTNQQLYQTRFWFIQSLTKDMPLSPNQSITFEIRIKPLYLLDTFYVGIGIGGIPLDLNAIQHEQQGTVDRYNHSKMVVFKKEHTANTVSLGIYQHETVDPQAVDGWINASAPAPDFKPGTWYRLRATLDQESLAVQVWKESDPVPSPLRVAVAPLPTSDENNKPITQVPLSVIYSGASVAFDIVNPSQTTAIQATPLYTSAQGPAQTEAQREGNRQKTYQNLRKPSFGTFTQLNAADNFELLKGHFIYTTPETNIAQETQKLLSQDYVVLAQLNTATQPPTPIAVGLSPLSNASTAPNAIISLITGKAFDENKTFISYISNVWTPYVVQNKAINSFINTTLTNAITQARLRYAKLLAKLYTFGVFTLSATSIDAMLAGHYIYKTTINKIPDYVIMAHLVDNGIQSYGMPYDPTNQQINGLISLANDQLYTSSSTTPLSSTGDILTAYTQATGPLDASLLAAINQAHAAAQKAQLAAATTQVSSTGSAAATTTPSSAVTTTGGQEPPATVPQLTGQAEASLAQLQNQASAPPSQW